MSIHDISVRIFKERCTQELAVEMQRKGWLLSVLTLNDRLVWLQATKSGRRLEAEVRGLADVANACGVLMAEVRRVEDQAVKTAA